MEGEAAVQRGARRDREAKAKKADVSLDTADGSPRCAPTTSTSSTRASPTRGFIDAIVYPEGTRDVIALALRAALQNRGPHLGPFVLPAHFDDA